MMKSSNTCIDTHTNSIIIMKETDKGRRVEIVTKIIKVVHINRHSET